jgi:hypothetical protein
MTRSLLAQLQQQKLDVKVGTPIDHFSAVTAAQQLCTGSGAQAIIVPDVRIEQSSATGPLARVFASLLANTVAHLRGLAPYIPALNDGALWRIW